VAADAALVWAWLVTRSIARHLPEPIEDFGGFRVDTNSEKEVRRWVFPALVDGVARLASSIGEPGHVIKLCGTGDELAAALPGHWLVDGGRWFMAFEGQRAWSRSAGLPPRAAPRRLRLEGGDHDRNGRARFERLCCRGGGRLRL
jgi:hypothetical protein